MKTLLIACEVLRPELEVLASDMRNPPPMNFLEQRLHDYPEKLRSAFQGLVDAFEQENDGPLAVLCGYGLCGRGLSGVHASRATLVFPKLHDCIPLLLGLDQKGANASSREGATYWISPGWLKYFLVPFHLESYRRFSVYEKKFGAAKAARMMKAENALLDNYKNACHIRWPEMGDAYVDEKWRRLRCCRTPRYGDLPLIWPSCCTVGNPGSGFCTSCRGRRSIWMLKARFAL